MRDSALISLISINWHQLEIKLKTTHLPSRSIIVWLLRINFRAPRTWFRSGTNHNNSSNDNIFACNDFCFFNNVPSTLLCVLIHINTCIYNWWTEVDVRTDRPSTTWTDSNDRTWLFVIDGLHPQAHGRSVSSGAWIASFSLSGGKDGFRSFWGVQAGPSSWEKKYCTLIFANLGSIIHSDTLPLFIINLVTFTRIVINA